MRISASVEFIVSGDDVLDLGAVLGLLDGEGVDENGGIWKGEAEAFELGQGAVGCSERFP